MQLNESVGNLEKEEVLIIKDYIAPGKKRTSEKVLADIRNLEYDELMKMDKIAKFLGYKEYDNYEELVEDVDKLLNDDDYLSERESLLQGSIITEARFVKNVRTTIEEHRTDYVHGSERIDTSKFKQEFF